MNAHYLRKTKWVAAMALWFLQQLPSASAAGLLGAMQDYRVPSKQGQMLKALGVGDIVPRTEAREEVDRGGEGDLRRLIYLPSNAHELVEGLNMLLHHAKQGAKGPSVQAKVRSRRHAQYPVLDHGCHEAYGVLVAVTDTGPRLEIDLRGLQEAYPEQLEVLPTAAWQAPWKGSVGLKFVMPEGPLQVYFPTIYSGFEPTANYRYPWDLSRDERDPEALPVLNGRELHSIQLLHALAREDAPKFDALWVFYDGNFSVKEKHYRIHRASHLRAANQANDYAHHQSMRLLDEYSSSRGGGEACEAFYTKMWAHMQQHSELGGASVDDEKRLFMEQLRALEAEENVPFLRELEEEGILDEKLLPEHPFTFRRLSLLQAYGTMSLPFYANSDSGPNMIETRYDHSSKEKRVAMGDMSWSAGTIYVHGGAESSVPDGIWDGRFLLFPREHGHMLNVGVFGSNNGGIVPHTRPDRFRDGLHSGFAKKGNIWWVNGLDRRYEEQIAALVQSIWQAPGRFWYEKRPVQPAPTPPLAALEEDRKPAARPTIVPPRPEETQPLLGTSEEPAEQHGGWMERIKSMPLPGTGHTIGGAAAAVGLAASAPATRRLVAAHPVTTGVVVTAGIVGGAYYASRTSEGQGGQVASEALKFKFSNAEDTRKLTVEITCGEEEPVRVVLHEEEENKVCCEGINLKNKLCLYTLLEDAAGKVTLYKEMEREICESGWNPDYTKRTPESILKRMKEKVAKSNPSSSNSRWNWLPGRGSSEEAPGVKPIGYLLIGDVASVKEVLDQWEREGQYNPRTKGTIMTPLNELEEAMVKALYEADPHRTIYCGGWHDFEREKGKADGWLAEAIKRNPWLENMQLRIITNRGEVRWEAS